MNFLARGKMIWLHFTSVSHFIKFMNFVDDLFSAFHYIILVVPLTIKARVLMNNKLAFLYQQI